MEMLSTKGILLSFSGRQTTRQTSTKSRSAEIFQIAGQIKPISQEMLYLPLGEETMPRSRFSENKAVSRYYTCL